MDKALETQQTGQWIGSAVNKKRVVGLLVFVALLTLFFTFNRLPKVDIVEGDLAAVSGPELQCFQGFCIDRDPDSSLLSRWWSFSVTYLRLVTIGMVFAFLVAGLAESFLFADSSTIGFLNRGILRRTLHGVAVGPVMNLCSACIVPVTSAYRRRGGGIEGAVGMVQGSATLNIPGVLMTFFVFTPLLGFSRLAFGLVGAVAIGPIVAKVASRWGRDSFAEVEAMEPEEPNEVAPWKPVLTQGFRDWARVSIGYLVRLGPIMIVAGFASGLAMQWISQDTVTTYLGNDAVGIVIAATLGLLINVPLLFEIPLVALLLILGMGTAPAATLLFAAAAGGPITFWGLAKVMPRPAIASFAIATWVVGVTGGLVILAIGFVAPQLV